MHDIKSIRADPAAFVALLERRGDFADEKFLRQLLLAAQTLKEDSDAQQARMNSINQEIATINKEAKAFQKEFNELKFDSEELKDNKERLEEQLAERLRMIEQCKKMTEAARAAYPYLKEAADKAMNGWEELQRTLPNLPAPEVPDGLDESANVVVATHGTPPAFAFAPKEHDTLALRFGYDPDAAAAIAGARFAVLKGPLARLHRALGQWLLDANVAAGWTEVAPPLLVHERALFGVGQLPKFEDDLFKTTDAPPRYLIPTSEASLTNLIRGRVLDADELPLRFTALTPCFRAEAGSAGRDTRGLIRQHQFDKVEIVAIVADAAAAAAMHEAMTRQAEGLLDALGLPYRRVLLCAGDMGFAARKTFDLEVWLPGQGAYREISSVSDCGDFQARRMDVDEPKGGRFKVRGTKGTQFVHTLNGSALAVGRTLVAVIENYQRADGSVAVPEVLLPYMGGVSELVPG